MNKNQTIGLLAVIILAASITGIVIASVNFSGKLHDIEQQKAIDETVRQNNEYLAGQ